MQTRKISTTKRKKITITRIIAFILTIITIPALSLIEIPHENNEPSFSIKFDMSKQDEQENIETQEEKIQEVINIGISQEDYDNNNFYLIQNYKTGEVVSITPTEYIKGVVAAEMPISFHDEALKAQAITAHSYVLRQIATQISSNSNELNGAYLSNDPTKFQACYFEEERKEFWGEKYDEYEIKLTEIVSEVITQIAVAGNEPIIGAFHAISNGQTETAEEVWGQAVSYLVTASSIGDQYSPNYETTTILLSSEVETAIKKAYPKIQLDDNINNWFSEIVINDSGRVSTIKVGDIEITGHELRSILKLRSTSFEIAVEGDEIIFTQTGYGHGVGLSQYGADYMARQGYTYDEILKHYYNGIDIVYLQ